MPQGHKNWIGCNIRPGSRPGGFSKPFASSRQAAYRPLDAPDRFSLQEINQAATEALERRGLINQPEYWRDFSNQAAAKGSAKQSP